MTIHIEDLTFDVIIGLLDFERITPQSVIVNIEASYDYSNNNFINYVDMVALVESELKDKEYKLLEDALLGVKDRLYNLYPQLQILYIKISKPDILPLCKVSLSKTWNL